MKHRMPMSTENATVTENVMPKGPSRRAFLSKMGAAVAAGVVLAKAPNAAAQNQDYCTIPPNVTDPFVIKCYEYRVDTAQADAQVPVPPHDHNNDQTQYTDHSGTYTKCLNQRSPGIVFENSYETFTHALATGQFADFENIVIGPGGRPLCDPEAGYACDLEGLTSDQIGDAPYPPNDPHEPNIVPPAFALASADYAVELVEQYWASLLRDVAFTDYPGNSMAQAAAQELTTYALAGTYHGPTNNNGAVTQKLLFRGDFFGETIGPYVSQLLLTDTVDGAQPMSQKYFTYPAGVNYMTVRGETYDGDGDWFNIQDAQKFPPNYPNVGPVYLHNGRGLAAETHFDSVYQEAFNALIVMMRTLGVPLNPGNPYNNSRSEEGFVTFGPPDLRRPWPKSPPAL